MKKIYTLVCMLLFASASFAQARHNSYMNLWKPDNSVITWKSVVGVITAQGVPNPVSNNINSGTFAWSVRSGRAQVNLTNSTANFNVEGLVINGTMFSGTAGPITSVIGTLVCDPGTDKETTFDTAGVDLSLAGDARFAGKLPDAPSVCDNALFLIRINGIPSAQGRWIATGAQPSFGNEL